MTFREVEEMLKRKPITEIPLRVCLYARVSTDTDEQATSIVNQVDAYRNMIEENPNWTFAGAYVDEGISGLATKHREAFNRMIEDGLDGKFDLIITKAVARFARNVVDGVQYARDLKAADVGVWYHTDNILTYDKDSEFKLALLAAFAQEESLKKSEAVRFGLKQAIKRGQVFGFDNMFGYRKKNGRLVIEESEVPIVKTIFELYATDQYSMKQIEKILYERGYRNHKGNAISHATMAHMIKNPKYKGYFVGNKVLTTDVFSKKFIMLPESEWIMWKDESIVPAIVSEELWKKANDVLERRSKDVKNRQGLCNHPNLMTGKIYCVHCGRTYHRKSSKDKRKGGNNNSAWVCSGKIRNGTASCPSKYLYENEIRTVLYEVFRESKFDVEQYFEKYVAILEEALHTDDLDMRIVEINKELEGIKKRKNVLLRLVASGNMEEDDFAEMNKELQAERKKLEVELSSIEDLKISHESAEKKLEEVRSILKGMQVKDGEEYLINNVFVKNYIDRIDVEMKDGNPQLTIVLTAGMKVKKQIEKISTGYKSLVIFPVRRLLFQRLDASNRSINPIEIGVDLKII